ncbi:Reticulon-like protein B11 [Zostera marina]|uniref:Reticulon-like protein n=1 Tax=Zostera marina TaxID=29655 RepID=A0A0K9NZY7_ZOSMR|nr:Reticulon-like protein B11 [Zostera marina]
MADDRGSASALRSSISVHGLMGEGRFADVLLWRRPRLSGYILGIMTVSWFLFEVAGHSMLSLIAKALLLLVSILFFWARSAAILNRPLPPLPNLDLSDRAIDKITDCLRIWINSGMDVARGIAVGGELLLFLKVMLYLWIASYVGSLCNFLTLLFIVVSISFTIPALYEKYQDLINDSLMSFYVSAKNIFKSSKTSSIKEKKHD